MTRSLVAVLLFWAYVVTMAACLSLTNRAMAQDFPVQDTRGVGTLIDIRDIALVEDMGDWVRLSVTKLSQPPIHPGRQLHHHRTLSAFLAQMAIVSPSWLTHYAMICPMLPPYRPAMVSRDHVWQDGVRPFVGAVVHLGQPRGWLIYRISREPLAYVQYYTCLWPLELRWKLEDVSAGRGIVTQR